MVLRAKPAGQCSKRCGSLVLLAGLLFLAIGGAGAAWPQAEPGAVSPKAAQTPARPVPVSPPQRQAPRSGANSFAQWEGLPVLRESFEGVNTDRLAPLPGHLPQAVGAPLSRDNVALSLRRLFATGLFETIEVEATREANGVALNFKGEPRMFIGRISVYGAKGATINTQLEHAGQLNAGTRFTPDRLNLALDRMRQALADNGFHEPAITHTLTPHPEEQLVDIAFHVVSGPQARVGSVDVTGTPGMSAEEFREKAHLRSGRRVDHDTANRALSGVLKHYQKKDRLEADVKLESQTYAPDTDRSSFRFSASQGPVVRVRVEGAGIGNDRLKRLVPVFEEGTVDDDLLNEGNRRLRDYYQSLGYFDVKVDHKRLTPQPNEVEIVYSVTLGPRRHVERVSVDGNHYFDSATLEELLSVRAADTFDRHGAYSQALVSTDIASLQAVYQNNGFSSIKITPETSLVITAKAQARMAAHKSVKPAPLAVVYHINEGPQQRVGTVQLDGNDHVAADQLTPLMNTAPGQLLSPQSLAGDRDALMTDYLSRGFDQVRVQLEQLPDPADAHKVNVVFHISEGQQIFVRKVLLSGLHYTRPDTVARAITLHPGDPLNQSALLETQRNLYDFALFNEVNTAVQNPTGAEAYKTVLLHAVEARRWALTYGIGFEAQTGTPQNNCRGLTTGGASCNPNGKTGISPRVLMDITRNDLFGREQSASIRGTYGLLEQKIDLLFQNPHFHGNRNFGLTFSGGYANSQDVTTYVASKLEAGMRWTEQFNTPGIGLSKANTFIYEFNFRRVKVAANSLQVGPDQLTALSTATRVAGPGFTWIRDTRDSPLDAHRGTYSSFQEFFSDGVFGAQSQFNRLDLSNSSFYGFDRDRFVLARNTRYAQERSFGSPAETLIPLPERLYAGGPTSLRGFTINAAGPRDPQTGYPVGGAGALVNSTELRLPPPTLPWLGNTLSFVLFHDMGNIFANSTDIWTSAARVRQPNRDKCTLALKVCDLNYFSHAGGLGLRYHTPVGPIRLDFSYNLNPPIYVVTYNYSQADPTANPHIGNAGHFNFFFSLGQSF